MCIVSPVLLKYMIENRLHVPSDWDAIMMKSIEDSEQSLELDEGYMKPADCQALVQHGTQSLTDCTKDLRLFGDTLAAISAACLERITNAPWSSDVINSMIMRYETATAFAKQCGSAAVLSAEDMGLLQAARGRINATLRVVQEMANTFNATPPTTKDALAAFEASETKRANSPLAEDLRSKIQKNESTPIVITGSLEAPFSHCKHVLGPSDTFHNHSHIPSWMVATIDALEWAITIPLTRAPLETLEG